MAANFQASWWKLYETWPFDRVCAFDRTVNQFETAWQEGRVAPIEPVLEQSLPNEHAVWLAELLAIEIMARQNRRETLHSEEFVQRFPTDAETIRTVWAEVSQLSPLIARPPAIAGTQLPLAATAILHCFQPGALLDGRYRVESFITASNVSELYRARRLNDGLPVAIKVLRLSHSFTPDETALARFRREMDILGRLRHPNLVSAIECIYSPQRPPSIVMDWVDGQNAEFVTHCNGPMPPAIACEVIRQAALGLAEAWRAVELVHRDIKPSNLMLTYSGLVKVLDYGFARAPKLLTGNPLEYHTSNQFCFGTPDFMAPEQWEDVTNVTPSTDVYGLGCTLYYLLTNEAPFQARNSNETKSLAHRHLAPPDVRRRRTDVPIELSRLIRRMLEKAPQDRPSNCNQLAQDLAPWAAGADLQKWIAGKWSEPQFVAMSSAKVGRAPFSDPRLPQTLLRRWKRRSALLTGISLIGGVVGLAWNVRSYYLPPPQILAFNITVYRLNADNVPEKVGDIGETLFSAPAGSRVQLRFRLDVPANVQIVAANSTGEIQLLATSTDDMAIETLNKPAIDLVFPRQELWELDDTAGLQAFILIASRNHLPAFTELQSKTKLQSAWRRAIHQGVWKSHGDRIQPMLAEDDTPRGQLVTIVPEVLRDLWNHIATGLSDKTVIALVAFPIHD